MYDNLGPLRGHDTNRLFLMRYPEFEGWGHQLKPQKSRSRMGFHPRVSRNLGNPFHVAYQQPARTFAKNARSDFA